MGIHDTAVAQLDRAPPSQTTYTTCTKTPAFHSMTNLRMVEPPNDINHGNTHKMDSSPTWPAASVKVASRQPHMYVPNTPYAHCTRTSTLPRTLHRACSSSSANSYSHNATAVLRAVTGAPHRTGAHMRLFATRALSLGAAMDQAPCQGVQQANLEGLSLQRVTTARLLQQSSELLRERCRTPRVRAALCQESAQLRAASPSRLALPIRRPPSAAGRPAV